MTYGKDSYIFDVKLTLHVVMGGSVENSVKSLRQKMGISQAGLGEALGVSRQTINSIESGRYNPSILLAFKISKVFNLTIEEIFVYREVEDND